VLPVVLSVPAEAVHVTAVFAAFVTVAVNWLDSPVNRLALAGDMLTATEGPGSVPPSPPHAARAGSTRIAVAATPRRHIRVDMRGSSQDVWLNGVATFTDLLDRYAH
jgi:hypothetical protein